MTPSHPANPIPNILTGLRLFAGVIMFLILAGAAPQGVPILSEYLSPDDQFRFGRTAFVIFVVAASTDWIDGFLARRWNATTRWGAILDPIADKVLVTGAILGVLAWGALPQIAIPCGLILFREFAVSALRETVAGKVKLPVTLLAKWKTVLQMVALGALQCCPAVGRLRPAAGMAAAFPDVRLCPDLGWPPSSPSGPAGSISRRPSRR